MVIEPELSDNDKWLYTLKVVQEMQAVIARLRADLEKCQRECKCRRCPAEIVTRTIGGAQR